MSLPSSDRVGSRKGEGSWHNAGWNKAFGVETLARKGAGRLQGCSVNVDEGAHRSRGRGGGRVAQTGAIKMQIISFHAAIFPEETGARNPTPSPINLELIYDDDDSIVRR